MSLRQAVRMSLAWQNAAAKRLAAKRVKQGAFAAAHGFVHHPVDMDGNCQFAAFLAGLPDGVRPDWADAEEGVDALRCLVVTEMGSRRSEYEPYFFDEERSWDDYLAFMNRKGSWGDASTLHCMAEMFGVRVEVLRFGRRQQDWSSHVAAGIADDAPVVYLFLEPEIHYDFMVPQADEGARADEGRHANVGSQAAVGRQAAVGAQVDLPAAADAGSENKPVLPLRKRPAAAGRVAAYDLSSRLPPQARLKHKMVCDEARIAPGAKELYRLRAGNSVVSGGVLNRIQEVSTMEAHWADLRRFVGWLDAERAKAQLPLEQPWTLDRVLADDNLLAYFKHLQDSPSSLGRPRMPSTVRTITNRLAVLAEVFVKHKAVPGAKKLRVAQRRKGNALMKRIRRLGGSVTKALAAKGDERSLQADDGKQAAPSEPLTLSQMLENRQKYLDSIGRLRKRIKVLDDMPEKRARKGQKQVVDTSYMRLLLARRRMAVIGADFIAHTNERIEAVRRLVHGRKIVLLDDGRAEYRPTGRQATKTEKSKRLKRGYAASRKFLSAKWATRLKQWMARDLPVLQEFAAERKGWQEDVVSRPGEDAFSLFAMVPASDFRKLVNRVFRCGCNDIRAVMEYNLKTTMNAFKVNPEVVQSHVGHDRKVSQRHYQTAEKGAMADLIGHLLPDL